MIIKKSKAIYSIVFYLTWMCVGILCSSNVNAQEQRGLMIDRLEALVCDSAGIDSLNTWIDFNRINTVHLYLSELFIRENPAFYQQWVTSFKERGIKVYGVISPSSFEPLRLSEYCKYLDNLDGLFIEFEYWNQNIPYRHFKLFCIELHELLPNMPLLHYIGWPAATYYEGVKRLRFMYGISNEIAVHLYRKDVDLSFVRNRLQALNQVAKENKDVFKVSMLYSSEPGYMMEKLKEKTLDEIHQEFLRIVKKKMRLKNLEFNGFIWFKASDLVGY